MDSRHRHLLVVALFAFLTACGGGGGGGGGTDADTSSPPSVTDDAATTAEDSAVTVDVLANDTDAVADTVTVDTPPDNGATGVDASTGGITYTPDDDFNGADAFTYTVDSATGDTSEPATVNISVDPVNDPPVFTAGGDQTVPEDAGAQTVGNWATDLGTGAANESDQSLTGFSVTNDNNGLFTTQPAVDVGGTLTWASAPDANGSATVSVSLSDDGGSPNGGSDTSVVQTFTITITAVNDAPSAGDDNASVDEDDSVAIDVLANDSDVDGSIDASSVSVTSAPTDGTTTVDAGTGAVTYTPDADFNGTDSFQYTVDDDGGATSNTATVSLSVNATPQAADDNASVDEDDSVTIDVLANDSDSDGSIDASTVTVTSAPTDGTTTVDAGTGAVTYTPDADFNGADSFQYTVDDDGGATSNTATVSVSVNPLLDITNLTVGAGTEPKELDFGWAIDGEEPVDHYRLEVNPDGASGYTPVTGAGNIATTSFTLTAAVHLTDWVNALYRVVALDASNNELASSAGIGLLNNVTAEAVTGYFKASNTGGSDLYGRSVALSATGDTLAVGANGEDSNATGIDGNESDNSAFSSGAVYVFTRDGSGHWSQQAYVKASNTDGGDQFGWSVALSDSGDTLAVGAPEEDSAATGIGGNEGDNSASEAGAVYVFTRTSGAWSQQAYVKASNTDGGDQLGESVALSANGDTLAVGAVSEDSVATGIGGDETNNSVLGAGAVYVFTRTSGTWSQQAYVKASNTNGSDFFGANVALSGSGDTLAVGAHGEDSSATGIDGDESDDSAESAGAIYVFTRTSGTWSQQAYVKASNTDSFDGFGGSMALSATGDTLAVGVFPEDSTATGIDGDQSDNSAQSAGAVYVFTRTSSTWSQQAYVKASNTDSLDGFGRSVALSDSGDTLAVGAYLEDSNTTGIDGDETDNSAESAGAIYVFTRTSGTWSQQAYVKASNTDDGDQSGWSVALSATGDTLAVGAISENSVATGIDGDETDNSADGSGAAYLY